MRTWFAATALAVALPGVVRADTLEAPQGDAREMAHAVEVRRSGNLAVVEVTRTFISYEKRPEQLALTIDAPHGAVARESPARRGEARQEQGRGQEPVLDAHAMDLAVIQVPGEARSSDAASASKYALIPSQADGVKPAG